MSTVPKTMRGVKIETTGGIEVLEYVSDLPVPIPKDDEVLVKIEYSGVNFIDTYFRTGLYPAPHFPFIPGRECIGTLASQAPPSTHLSSLPQGSCTRLLCLAESTYAEYCTAKVTHTHPLPASPSSGPGYLSSDLACAIFLQGLTALTLIRESHAVQPGEWTLVHAAAGGTGNVLCQLLAATGARVIGVVGSEAKRATAAPYCEVLIVNADRNDEVVLDAVMRATDNVGVAAVFDGVGKTTFDLSLRCVARKGSLVSFGNASGAVEPVSISRLAPKNVRLLRPQLYGYIATREEFEMYTTELFEFVAQGKLDIKIHEIYKLEDVARAHTDIEGRKTTGKLLLRP